MHSADNYSLRSYGRMVEDQGRTRPFVEALRRLVGPQSVVLDIGTGPGFFAFVAAQFGAARVYAVEPDDSIQIGRLCATQIDNSARITWIQGLSTGLDLPERVDIVVGDLHGTLPFYNAMIASLIDARTRHLKPGGTILPARDVLRVVPATAPDEYTDVDRPWQQNDYALDLSAGRSYVANSWWRAGPEPVDATRLLSAPATWGVIDYLQVQSANLDNRLRWSIDGPGTMHGYYVWFDSEMPGGLGCSNAPDLPELVYGRTFFPLEQPVEMEVGECVELHLSTRLMDDTHVYRWDSRLLDRQGRLKAQFHQSTFRSKPIQRRQLLAHAPDVVPKLTQDGEIARTVLDAIARAQSLDAIANLLARQFPLLYETAAAAMPQAVKLSRKYAGDDLTTLPRDFVSGPGSNPAG